MRRTRLLRADPRGMGGHQGSARSRRPARSDPPEGRDGRHDRPCDRGFRRRRRAHPRASGSRLSAPTSPHAADQAIVIEMGGMIVMPGIIDGHRHCWQNQFRRVIPDADLSEYVKTLHGDFAVEYRPHDLYVGNFLTMLTLLDAGVTCITDCSHNLRTRAHTDAVFKSYIDSGIRAVHAGGPSNTGVLGRASAAGPDPGPRPVLLRGRLAHHGPHVHRHAPPDAGAGPLRLRPRAWFRHHHGCDHGAALRGNRRAWPRAVCSDRI